MLGSPSMAAWSVACRTMCLCCWFNFFPFGSLIWCLSILFAPPQLLQVSSQLPSHPAFLFLLLPPLYLSSCPICVAQILHPLNCGQPTRGHTFQLAADSFCTLPFILCWVLDVTPPLPPVRGFCLAWACRGLAHVTQPLWVNLCKCPGVSGKHFRYSHLWSLVLLVFLDSWALREGCDIDVSPRAKHSTASSLQHDQLKISVLIAIYCKKLVWWRFRAALTCGCNDVMGLFIYVYLVQW